MDPNVLLVLISALVQIFNRHIRAHPDEPLTDEMVLDELRKELADGQSLIALEFAAKGVTLPN